MERNEKSVSVSRSGYIGRDGQVLSLAESAAHRVSDMIRRGELLEGQRLPPERELAETLNLSRGALREGLRMLETIGMLKARVGSGRYVSVSGSEDLGNGLATWMHMQSIGDIIAVRRLLEPAAVNSIPHTQLDEFAKQCASHIAKMTAAFKKGQHEAAMRSHTQFHLALIQFAPAKLHRALLTSMIKTTQTAQLEIFRNPEAGRASIAVHIGILDALKAGDVDEASRRDADHLVPAFVYSPTEAYESDLESGGTEA